MSARNIVVAGKKLGRHTDEAWLRGRQKGYDSGVENERILVLQAMEVEAKERDTLGLKDEAKAIRFLARQIEQGLHVTAGKPK